jgi:hypothetical protein
MSTPTTEHGDWNLGYTISPEDYIGEALGTFGEDFDVDGIVAEFVEAVNAELPDGVGVHGRTIIGPYPRLDIDLDAAVGRVDFWAIVQRHEVSNPA